jgi:hypothetical protein
MKILIPTALLTPAALGFTPLLHAEDSDKDVDAAFEQANNAAKKMGLKISRVTVIAPLPVPTTEGED